MNIPLLPALFIIGIICIIWFLYRFVKTPSYDGEAVGMWSLTALVHDTIPMLFAGFVMLFIHVAFTDMHPVNAGVDLEPAKNIVEACALMIFIPTPFVMNLFMHGQGMGCISSAVLLLFGVWLWML
jgi:hypothetical protein